MSIRDPGNQYLYLVVGGRAIAELSLKFGDGLAGQAAAVMG
jgi:hypothetical protein